MPSVQMSAGVFAVALESIGSGSAGSPYTVMGWVRNITGFGRSNNPLLASFRISGSSGETEGNIGYSTRFAAFDDIGRDNIVLSVVNWSAGAVRRKQFPDITTWQYVVLQLGSGSATNANMKVFDDSSLTKSIADLNAFYGSIVTVPRYIGISGGGGGGAQFRDVRAFYSGAFTDEECIVQALSRTPVAHGTAVLWDAWPLDSLQFTGSINNKVLRVAGGTPRLAPDQPFVFINPTTSVTGSDSSQVQISTTGYAPVIIGAR